MLNIGFDTASFLAQIGLLEGLRSHLPLLDFVGQVLIPVYNLFAHHLQLFSFVVLEHLLIFLCQLAESNHFLGTLRALWPDMDGRTHY